MKIMIDLETLSTANNAAVVAIGAVPFSETEVQESRKFYRIITPQSAEEAGGHISGSTFQWWCRQSDAAREMFSIKAAAIPLKEALIDFGKWCGVVGVDEMWGNGADFDCVILANAFAATNLFRPWEFKKNRCFRTLRTLVPPEVANELWDRFIGEGTHHNAVDDAVRQAKIAVEIFKRLRRVQNGPALTAV